jgi:hypothetical protein
VRPESCDSPSSPEPAASLFGDGLFGRGLWGERAARTPCAPRAVILPAVQSLRLACSETGWLGGGLWGVGGEKWEKQGGMSLVGVVGGGERGVRDVGRAGLRRIGFVTLRDWPGLVSMGWASCSGAAGV